LEIFLCAVVVWTLENFRLLAPLPHRSISDLITTHLTRVHWVLFFSNVIIVIGDRSAFTNYTQFYFLLFLLCFYFFFACCKMTPNGPRRLCIYTITISRIDLVRMKGSLSYINYAYKNIATCYDNVVAETAFSGHDDFRD